MSEELILYQCRLPDKSLGLQSQWSHFLYFVKYLQREPPFFFLRDEYRTKARCRCDHKSSSTVKLALPKAIRDLAFERWKSRAQVHQQQQKIQLRLLKEFLFW